MPCSCVVRPGQTDDRPEIDRRKVELGDCINVFVFGMLMGERTYSAEDATAIAAACERAFLECVR